MSGVTLAQAQAQLDAWLAASLACAGNQSYRMPDGRTLTRANAAEIRENVEFWERRVDRLSGSGKIRGKRVVPV